MDDEGDSRRGYGSWAPYVPVAKRREQAEKKASQLRKSGKSLSPVRIEGRTVARSFWGKAWCDNLEAYSDYANRLPRGRTYVRNGSVIHLEIKPGEITALVSGSSIYTVKISVQPLEKSRWKSVIETCSGQIDSLVELLQGKFSQGVMEVITCKKRGIFPTPKQIEMDCSCPDSAIMCKHVAAVLYGVGSRLDENPELFFGIRNVDQADLITAANVASVTSRSARPPKKTLQVEDLSGLFGIELETAPASKESSAKAKPKTKAKAKAKTRAKKKATQRRE